MLKSKRFIAYIISLTLFVIILVTTSFNPIEVATGLTMLTGIYIGAESFKPSPKKPDEIG